MCLGRSLWFSGPPRVWWSDSWPPWPFSNTRIYGSQFQSPRSKRLILHVQAWYQGQGVENGLCWIPTVCWYIQYQGVAFIMYWSLTTCYPDYTLLYWFIRTGRWGSERLNDFPKVTQLHNSTAGILDSGVLASKTYLLWCLCVVKKNGSNSFDNTSRTQASLSSCSVLIYSIPFIAVRWVSLLIIFRGEQWRHREVKQPSQSHKVVIGHVYAMLWG